MSTKVQIRRGSTSSANAFTGAEGELYVDTDQNDLRVHDGSTPGGFRLPNFDTVGALNSTKVDKINITAGTVGSGSQIPVISYNEQGQITTVSTSTLNIPSNIATETYVNAQIANLVDTAPTTLNTLNELATALGNDPNFATTITTQLGLKANTSSLATVATSGSYNNLTNKPFIVSTNTVIAIGQSALSQPTLSGEGNIGIGYSSLYRNVAGNNNIAIGYASLFDNVNGNDNIAIGYDSLRKTTVSGNIAIGKNTLSYNTTGSGNIAIGSAALQLNTTSNFNNAFGANALTNNLGEENSAFGFFSLYANTTGNYNTAYGNRSLRDVTTGWNNTAIGCLSGLNITTGNNNTIVGNFTGNQNGVDIRTSNNNIILSDGQGNIRFRSDSAGNITLNGNITSATFTGLVKLQQSSELIATKNNASSTVEHSFSQSSIWYHTSISSNFTPNFTNVPTDNNWNTIITLVLSQGATPYIPSSIQINGSAQTVKWLNAEVPEGNANSVDVISFSLMRVSSSWIVLGSLTGYA
jgi:hypothetical protein